VEIGDNLVSVSYAHSAKRSTYEVKQSKPWSMHFSPRTGSYKRWLLDGKLVEPTLVDGWPTLKLKGLQHHLVLID
jgi:hypothetical protein